jgi:hypothetical protein
MDILFKEKSQKIRIILATEQILDPYEKNVEFTELPSLPILAIVTDLTTTKVQYAMPGIVTDKAKEIIIEKKYESLLLKSYRIKIKNDYYIGWKQNGKLQYRIEGDYLRAYVYIEKV